MAKSDKSFLKIASNVLRYNVRPTRHYVETYVSNKDVKSLEQETIAHKSALLLNNLAHQPLLSYAVSK